MKRTMKKKNVKGQSEIIRSAGWNRAVSGILATTLLLTSVALSGCAKQTSAPVEEEKPSEVLVETSSVGTKSISVMSDFIGTIEANEETSIVPKIAGEVTSKNFEVGDYVNAGDLLFTIDDTALQISKSAAEASVASAAANLNTAQAALIAQEANNAATKATVNETIGTQDTTEMQLDNSVNNAKRGVGAAKGNNGLANQSFETYKDATDRVKDNQESADNSIGDAEDYLESLEFIQNRYSDIASKSNVDDAKNLAKSYGVEDSKISSLTDSRAVASVYLSDKTQFSSGEELAVAVATATSQYQAAKSTSKSMEGSYSSSLLAQIQAAISTQTSADSLKTAEEAEALAEKYRADYDNFTKAKIAAAANAQIVGGDAAVISSTNTVTSANANLASANASLASANLQLDYTKVTAPVSGVIQAINVQQYEIASQQTAAYVISSQDSKKITFYVAETAMRNMREGQTASIEKEGITYDATISSIDNTVDSGKGLFKVEAMVSGAGNEGFITGTSVKITTATQQAVDAMTVPIDAVYYESEQAYVYCLQDGKAIRTDITTGISDEEVVEVTGGLNADSRVITSWASQLKDGAIVKETAATSTKEESTEETTEETAIEETTTVEEIPADAMNEAEVMVEATDTVKIRSAASTDSEVVGMAAAGDQYTRIQETAEGWSKVIFEGSEAYIKSDYVKVVE